MATRNVTDWNDPIFRKKSRPVEEFDCRLHMLLDDMLETLRKYNGLGCAGVHVGVLRRAVVIDGDNGLIELINPVIAEKNGSQRIFEGSIAPNAPWGYVKRPKTVTVTAQDRNGKPTVLKCGGFLAATVCHEIDSLDGILFTDKADEIITDLKRVKRIIIKNPQCTVN